MNKKTAYLGLFLALALICSYIESLIPFYFGIPGVKLGLTNIVVVMMLYCIGAKEALLISLLRIVLAGFMFGNMFSILYSLAGGILSFLIMYLLKRYTGLHVISISAAGGISHNIGQLFVAALVVENYNILYYASVLIIAGIITGIMIGIVAQEVILRLNSGLIFKQREEYIMYAYIKGILAEITEDAIIVENQGIGYEIAVPGQVFDYLPSVGEEVKIYTYHYVREDAILLYGFLTKEDVRIFKMLIGVSGIGPKGALAILSVLSTDDLRFAILGDDAKAIAKAPGVGAKTAQRVIIELKDKLSLEDAFEQKLANQAQKAELNPAVGVKNEAILALTSLGYSQSEALKVLQGIEISPDDQVEDVLKMALKQMAFL